MKEMKNVVSATTANGSKSNEMIMNENAKIQMAKMKSVENGAVKAEDVVVSSPITGELVSKDAEIKRYGMYYGRRNGNLCKDRFCIVTNTEMSRGKRMITWIELERVDNEYDRKTGELTYWIFKAKRYRKSVDEKMYKAHYTEMVWGTHGIDSWDRISVEDLEKNTYFQNKTIVVLDDCVDYHYMEDNSAHNPAGFKFVKLSEKHAEEKEAAKENADGNEDMTAVMTAYAVESGDDNNDTQNAIDYFTNKMNDAQEEADVALTRKMIFLRGNGFSNDIELLKELDNDYSAALGRYYMYKKYVEILTKANEIEELPF